jgi:hypothetical protein
MKIAEPADDLVCKRRVVVTISENKGLADAFHETAFVINSIADVKHAPRG